MFNTANRTKDYEMAVAALKKPPHDWPTHLWPATVEGRKGFLDRWAGMAALLDWVHAGMLWRSREGTICPRGRDGIGALTLHRGSGDGAAGPGCVP